VKSSDNTKLYKEEILQRFIEFGQSKFGTDHGWQKKYAEALEMKQQQMSDILSMRSPIGAKIREKMQTLLGCDPMWLINGRTTEQLQSDFIAIRKRIAENSLPSDDKAMLNKLHELGILTVKDLEEKLNWKLLYDKKEESIRFKETQANYKSLKKKRGK